MKAFHANSFGGAITAWSYLSQDDPAVHTALAEAHFRRALGSAEPAKRLEDLQQAARLAPDDLRYQYHLGLTHHRAGNLDAAIDHYRTVLKHDASWSDAALVLAVATLEQNPKADISQLPGSNTVQKVLAPVQMLLRDDIPPSPDEEETGGIAKIVSGLRGGQSEKAIARLWHGLGLVQHQHKATSEVLGDEQQLPAAAVAVRRYYKGVAAAQKGDTEAALKQWQRVSEQGLLPTPWLRNNMAVLLHEKLSAQLEAGDLASIHETTQLALQAETGNNALNDLIIYALDMLAQHATTEGNWSLAIRHWEDARQLASSSSSLGSPRPLLQNLALAYEHLEQWHNAAEMWRAMLRTRPRKSSSTTGLPTDEQWSWVRKRVIECYKRAGTPDEAVTIFRQAIKADPHDLDIRFELAEALMANDQDQAAYNELQRIIERDPNHVDAHLLMAQIHDQWGRWWASEQSLRKVLQLNPERQDVRRRIAQMMLSRGINLQYRGLFAQARKAFEEGQQIDPENYQFPLNMARLLIDEQKQKKDADIRALLTQALELANEAPEAYAAVVECWAVLDNIEEARAVITHAENKLPDTSGFQLLVGMTLLRMQPVQPPPSPFAQLAPKPEAKKDQDVWSDLAIEALQRAMALQPQNVRLRIMIAEQVKLSHPGLALRFVEEAVNLTPEDPDTLILLGIIQALNEQNSEAKTTLRRAARLARQQGDHDLVEQANAIRQQVGSPFLRMSLQMAETFGDPDNIDFDRFDPYGDFF